jgi:Family of unknown function (DUF6134)
MAAAQGIGVKAALLLAGLLATSAHAAEWNFRALLDDKPIGTHRFTLSTQGDERKLLSEAAFAVKFIGITAYRYQHRATELWRGDCLAGLSAATDDDGKATTVEVIGEPLKGCAMSFAYWNPAIRTQLRLLNAQTGLFEKVQVTPAGAGSLDVRGTPTPATRWRITGPTNPIDVWYSAQGEWIGLDSTLAGGRKLSYRLQ